MLGDAGVDTPRVDAEWLMTHVFDCPRGELVLRHGAELSEAQQSQWDSFMAGRAARIPLQHLMGSADFCGLGIEVNEDAIAEYQLS